MTDCDHLIGYNYDGESPLRVRTLGAYPYMPDEPFQFCPHCGVAMDVRALIAAERADMEKRYEEGLRKEAERKRLLRWPL